jgi:hypothetical protein
MALLEVGGGEGTRRSRVSPIKLESCSEYWQFCEIQAKKATHISIMSRMQTLEEKHPELFRPDLNIDRRKCTRTVPMEVLALGMSRTGTSCK